MAVIGQIRKRTGLLITIIAIAIMGFLLMDATNSQSGVIRQGNDVLGQVAGSKINSIQFEEKVRKNEEVRKAQKGSTRAQLTDEEKRSIREETWTQFVEKSILSNLFDNIGLNVTGDELEEMTFGSMPHPFVVNQFRNPQTNQYDPTGLRNFLQTIDLPDPNVEPEVKRAQWQSFEDAIIEDRERSKLYDIVSKGLYIPNWQKELKQTESEQSVDFDFVMLPITQLADNEVEISEQQVKDFLKQNAKLYKQEPYRSIDYVTYDIKASSEDSSRILRDLATLNEEFSKVDNDSVWLRLNSQENYRGIYFKESDIPNATVKTLFEGEIGAFVGPFLEGNMFKYAKKLGHKKLADSVKLRQIVFDFNSLTSQDQADKKRGLYDSVYTLLDSFKMDFNTIVNAFSDDVVTKANGGNIGWLKFNEATDVQKALYFYNAGKGSIKKETLLQQNMLRIVEVVESNPIHEAIKLGYLSKTILPSEDTERAIYAKVSKFASENRTADDFRTAAGANSLQVLSANLIQDNTSFIAGIGYQARPIVRWLFEEKTEVGDVSRVFSTSEKHLVAVVTEVEEEGLKPLSKVETEIRNILTSKEKGKVLAKQFEDAGASLTEIASALGAEVKSATGLKTTNAQIPGGSWESNVVHAALDLEEGVMSKPIVGNSGVYVIQLKSKSAINPAQQQIYKRTIRQEYASSVNQNLIKALTESADVQDNRSKFF